METLIKTTVVDDRFSIIEPVLANPENPEILITSELSEWKDWILKYTKDVDIVAFDTETRGVDQHHPDFKCVGIGLSVGTHSIYLDTSNASDDHTKKAFLEISHLPLIAHNLYYDARVASRYLGTVRFKEGWMNYKFCTFGVAMQLAGEGFTGQQHGLKWIEKNMLGWGETNEVERDRWLVREGYITDKKKLKQLNTPELREARWEERNKNGSRKLKADPSEMWRCPAEILGHYCALDCLATWQIYKLLFIPALTKIPRDAYIKWHQEDFLTWVRAHVDAYMDGGMRANVSGLEQNSITTKKTITDQIQKLREHPKVKHHLEAWEKDLFKAYIDKEPPKYTKTKETKEPAKYLKNANRLSKSWFKWYFKKKWGICYEGTKNKSTGLSKNWIKWNLKRREIIAGLYDSDFKFNFSSPKQLQWLIYEKNFRYKRVREPDPDKKRPGVIKLAHNGLELKLTDSGELPTGKPALMGIGDFCKDILEIVKLEKQLNFNDTYMQRAMQDPEHQIYPEIRVPGTLTGRASGGGAKDSGLSAEFAFNALNPPKVKGILENLLPSRGFALWDEDVTALEPCVLAELSRDKGLLKVFGAGAKPNDVYLFVGSQLGEIADDILNDGYHPDNPDGAYSCPPDHLVYKQGLKFIVSKKEMKDLYLVYDNRVPHASTMTPRKVVKKKYKTLRSIFKVLHLGASYGAGPYTLWINLLIQGVRVTLDEVKVLHTAYWDLFSDVKVFGDKLMKEWDRTGGWFLDGFGLPICVHESKKKDAINRCIQNTGHKVLMKAIRIFYHKIEDLGWTSDVFRWFLVDMHDQFTPAIRGIKPEVVQKLIKDMEKELNEEIGSTVPIKFDGGIIKSFWDAKKD